MSAGAFSEDFVVDGISYNFLPDVDHEVAVANNGCNYFGDVDIPARVEYEGETYTVTALDYQAFFKCVDLATVTIPATVTDLGGYTFSQCTSLEEINLPSSTSSIPNGLCWGCSALKSITLPESVESIGEYAFANCTALKDINLPSGVSSMGKAALMGTAIEQFVLPEKVTEVSPFLLALTTKLTDVRLHDGVKTIGECAFQGNTVLKTIALPTDLESIEPSAFASCPSLETITIPDGITSIPDKCFYNDMALKRIIVGQSVTSIGADCFARYKSNASTPQLTDVYLAGDALVSGGESFLDEACAQATLHVQPALVDAYKTQSGWSRFSIVPIAEGELTGVGQIQANIAGGDAPVYTLDGKRTSTRFGGIVISQGKKYYVKK